jgi:glyoxylase-like metal-dependent hydrolase (beta-lactamase superfamily II)
MASSIDPLVLAETLPETASVIEILPGVNWLRMPLPMSLDHINIWLLDNGDGWAQVDTGMGTPETEQAWLQLIDESLQGKPINRLLVTHMHPDHMGMAGWLVDRFGVPLEMTRDEYLLCRILVADTFQPAPPEAIRFYRGLGFDDAQVANYIAKFGGFGRVVRRLPSCFKRLVEGQRLSIGGREWEVVIGRGHSPEHACLYCAELNVVISGDQILPNISSNISVWPTEPEANALADWLVSCEDLQHRLPEDVLVLPSHGRPFKGAHRRLQSLIRGHEQGLERIMTALDEPRRVIDLLEALFRRNTMVGEHFFMACGECMAHLNYLLGQGQIERYTDDDGAWWHRKISG